MANSCCCENDANSTSLSFIDIVVRMIVVDIVVDIVVTMIICK